MNEDKKNREILPGEASDLDISPDYDHIKSGKPKCNDEKPKNIVIPKEQKK